jgi:tetratricopeptide (TPR) repeat protein
VGALKVLNNLADIKSAGGVALRVRTQGTPGLIDFMWDAAQVSMTPAEDGEQSMRPEFPSLEDYVVGLKWDFRDMGSISFIPAGRQDENYAQRVNTFNWDNFYERLGGGKLLHAERERLRANYDYILIDSRTGVSDTSSICTVQMPDVLALFFTLNRQGILGAAGVAASVRAAVRAQRNEVLPIYPVPTRIENAEKEKKTAAINYARGVFTEFLRHVQSNRSSPEFDEQANYWNEVETPYEPFYAFEEIPAPFKDEAGSLSGVLASNVRIARWITGQAVAEMQPLDEDDCKKVVDAYAFAADEKRGIRWKPASAKPDTVFISYSHDSHEHSDRVLEFSNALRALGIDIELDQYHVRPQQGWPHWYEERLRPGNARNVLVICTSPYRNRVENKVGADEGGGVFWEGGDIYQYLYDDKGNTRFIPVLLGDATEDGIPSPLKGHARYRVKAYDLSDPGFEGLYRELTRQPAVAKPALGTKVVLGARAASAPAVAPPLPERPALTMFPAPAAPPTDISRIDRYAPKELIGREAEMKVIDDARAKAVAGETHPRVLTFVALGGEGKTALVAKWAITMAETNWPDCEAAFAWSFYSQGTREQRAASSDLFLAEALKFFSTPAVEGVESGHDKGRRLAQWIGDKRAALILDGLEPLQYAPTSPLAGQLKDEGLRALLKGLAQHNNGLCLVTTGYAVKDLASYGATAPQKDLASLSRQSGARLLEVLGVKGTRQERERLTEDMKGHALTLNLIGSYLRDAFGGDIRKRDLINLKQADTEERGGHAFRAMDAYVRWFEGDGQRGAQALAMLRLMGLFDRPADAGCLEALWRSPAIDGLTEPLTTMSEAQRNIVLTRLANAKLVTVNRDAGGALISLDAHPLLREFFAKQLRETRADAWKAAHRRLYEHLTATQDKPEPTLDDLQPLYQAVAHGCHAGMQQEACDKVYRDRILRGMGPDGFYSIRKLGAFGADLSALACFFDPPWRRVSTNLTLSTQSWLLSIAAVDLRALGRLDEAREPMLAALDMRVAQEDWMNAAAVANNLSELQLTLGDVGAAIRDGERAVMHADRSGDGLERIVNRAAHADALHQAGRRAEAEARFSEAEAMQATRQPEYPLLYSLSGFRYCDLLLDEAERSAWQQLFVGSARVPDVEADTSAVGSRGSIHDRASGALERLIKVNRTVLPHATQTLDWAERANFSLLDIGLDHLTLARAAIYESIPTGEPPERPHLSEAADYLRRAGQQDYLPRGLLIRALFRATTDDFDGAREDLDEAFEITERGPMRLHLADIHLHRARLFGLMPNRPVAYPWVSARDDLDAARKLIDECGYGRRREELEDAEAAWERLYGASGPRTAI